MPIGVYKRALKDEPKRQCCLCLYRVGLGCKRIVKLLRMTHKRIPILFAKEVGIFQVGRRPMRETDDVRAIRAKQDAQNKIAKVAVREQRKVERGVCREEQSAVRKAVASQKWRERYAGDTNLRDAVRAQGKLQWEKKKHDPAFIARKTAYLKEWRKRNPEKVNLWARNNPEQMKILRRRAKSKPKARLADRLRKRLREFLIKGQRIGSISILIGCSLDEFRAHIERQFKRGMTWANASTWYVDHIIPCAHFDLSDMKQQRQCFHFSNMRPLWALVNIKRGARVGPQTLPLGI